MELNYEMIYFSSWDFGDNTTSVSHTVSAASQMKDSYEHQIVKHIYLQDSAHHAYSFQGTGYIEEI